ncbi:hypothetical protein [Sphingosinicella terrae]|uniref:hypothetical protein n=1 Tax=Sphingosinicella terrae TaxID=2172047 RepID=UPI000E0DE553|nr:hypothetical protein [Sphingosinicella terrae]
MADVRGAIAGLVGPALFVLAGVQTGRLGASYEAMARPAPPTFVSVNYGLTFPSPPGVYHCPLPIGWIGSDHGTTLFLAPPATCGGAGYSSSSRRSAPVVPPHIRLYYGYVAWDDPVQTRCSGPEAALFLGQRRLLCRREDKARVELSVHAWYVSDADMESPTEAILTLVTTRQRLDRDRAAFAALAGRIRTCSFDGRRAASPEPCPPGEFY